jgi:putative ABC transport system permease protein
VTNLLRWTWLRVRALFGRRVLETDMQDEFRAHLEQSTARFVARGMSIEEARIAARREFGITAVVEEDARDSRGTRFIESLVADIRFAFRYFARKPLMSATIIIVLALGIGVNSALVTMIQAFTVRPAPGMAKDPAHVRVWGLAQPMGGEWSERKLSYAEVMELAAHKESFDKVGAWYFDALVVDVEGQDAPRTQSATFVSPEYWSAAGVTVTGPGFAVPQAGVPDMAAILSLRLAEEMFGSAEAAIAKTLLVNDRQVRVAGVAPRRFEGPMMDHDRSAVWLPVSALVPIKGESPRWVDESRFTTFARLAPGVQREQASATARAVVTRFMPDSLAAKGAKRTVEVLAIAGQFPAVLDEAEDMILTFSAVGLLALLILGVACTNVSSLLVAAAVGRRHEIAVRLSMGAPRSRVLRQLVTESAMLAITGGALGLLVNWWLTAWLQSKVQAELIPDFFTIAFTVAFALATGILFGLSPALHATRAGVATALKESGSGATRKSKLQGGFVVAQIVFSQPLLLLIALTLKNVTSEYQPEVSVSDRVITASFPTNTGGTASWTYYPAVDTLAQRLRLQPGVVAVVPEVASFARRMATNAAGVQVPVNLEATAPGYFALLDVPIILGRDVVLEDRSSRDFAVVMSSDLAREFFGDANPIGRRLPSFSTLQGSRDSAALVVVGVFDAKHATTREAGPRFYTATRGRWRADALLIRTAGPALTFASTFQSLVRSLTPGLPVQRVTTLAQVAESHRQDTFQLSVAAASAGALALGLASIGLFAVVALSVGQRRREIGIRIALGGRPLRVAGSFFTSGLRLCFFGVLLGLPVSLGAVKYFMSVAVGELPQMSMTLVGLSIAAVMLVVASAATWFPARRAATVDPTLALRAE